VCDSDLWSVVTNCVLKCPVNPITSPNPVYSHTQSPDLPVYIDAAYLAPVVHQQTEVWLHSVIQALCLWRDRPLSVQSAREIRGFIGRDYQDYLLSWGMWCRVDWQRVTFVSEEYAVSILWAQEATFYPEEGGNTFVHNVVNHLWLFYFEHWGSTFLRNVGSNLWHCVASQKTVISLRTVPLSIFTYLLSWKFRQLVPPKRRWHCTTPHTELHPRRQYLHC
jgi:hypothetical protein